MQIRSRPQYAHVQFDPSRRAADRITKKISAALAGNAQSSAATAVDHDSYGGRN
jgi:hypothetical protein